jgi:hypothetical protein
MFRGNHPKGRLAQSQLCSGLSISASVFHSQGAPTASYSTQIRVIINIINKPRQTHNCHRSQVCDVVITNTYIHDCSRFAQRPSEDAVRHPHQIITYRPSSPFSVTDTQSSQHRKTQASPGRPHRPGEGRRRPRGRKRTSRTTCSWCLRNRPRSTLIAGRTVLHTPPVMSLCFLQAKSRICRR